MNQEDYFSNQYSTICLRPDTLFHPDHDPAYPGCENTGVGGSGPAIWKALVEKGIPATGWEPLDDDIQDDAPSHSRWRVESDWLHLSEDEESLRPDFHVVEAVEISSRKLRFFSDNWRAEIAAVLEVLRDVENRGCRFITNGSTGLHIHIGRDGGESIPLRVAKNVFQLCTAFERLIDELHASQWISVPEEISERHCYYPLSFFHTYGPEYSAEKYTKSSLLLDRLQRIEQAQTYEDIGSFFTIERPEIGLHEVVTTGHNSIVNFDNLFPCPELGRFAQHLTGTIEFRQHTGTLDYLDIIAWVTLTCQMVEYCSKTAASDFLDLIIRGVDPKYTLDDFLHAVHCFEDVHDHYRNGAVIGVLGEGSHLTGSRVETSVDALIEQNDHECEARASRTFVKAAIDRKYSTGLYGIDSAVSKVSLPMSIVDPEFEKAIVSVQASGSDVWSEESGSRARAQVLGHFAQLYRDGKVYFNRGA